MYNIMIIDDEKIIREGLISSIDWNKYGFNIVAEAENGKKALELAQKVKPDLILTDIYMPIMDGIEFAKEIKRFFPDVVLIFLSGYNEFSYAQKAIEIGVFRYLTKPIQEEELLVALEEASKDLEHKELEKTKISKLKLLIKDSLPLLKERFFLNLVKGKFKENEIHNKLNYLNISIIPNYDRFFSIIISLDDYFSLSEKRDEYDINLLKFAIQNMSEEILSEVEGSFHIFEDRRNEVGILCCFNNDKENNYLSILYPALLKIQECVRTYLKTTVSMGIGRYYDKLSKVNKSYREAIDSLEFRTAFGKNSIIFIGDIKPTGKYTLSTTAFEKVNELIKAVKGGNKELSLCIVDEIFEIFKAEASLKKDYLHMFIIDVLTKLVRVILEFDGDTAVVYGNKFTPLELLNFDTLEDIRVRFQESICNTIEFINSKRKVVNRNFIEKAKEFINENYGQEGLNLATIAESVHISPGYLSQLFKQVAGESCVEYLTKVRINHAKKLLKETNLKTYEIAYKVGYSDSQYFSTCFKKIMGVSPTDYRDVITKDIFG